MRKQNACAGMDKGWGMRARRAGAGSTGCNCWKSSEQQFCPNLCHSTYCSQCIRPAQPGTLPVRTPPAVRPPLFMPSDLGNINQPSLAPGPTLAPCEMRPLRHDQVTFERKAKKDAPAAVFSRAACVSRTPPADASGRALSGWGRPAWSHCVNLLSTMFFISVDVAIVKRNVNPQWDMHILLSFLLSFLSFLGC